MSLKEFSVRCSAITHITAHAYGIVQAIGPRRPPSAATAKVARRHTEKRPGFCLNSLAIPERA